MRKAQIATIQIILKHDEGAASDFISEMLRPEEERLRDAGAIIDWRYTAHWRETAVRDAGVYNEGEAFTSQHDSQRPEPHTIAGPHTPEPWVVQGKGVHHLLFQEPLDPRNIICRAPNDNPESLSNLRRIAACVNACQGYTTERLETIVTEGETLRIRALHRDKRDAAHIASLRQQVTELLAACNGMVDGWGGNLTEPMARIRAAIANATP